MRRAILIAFCVLSALAFIVSGAAYLLHDGYERQVQSVMDFELAALANLTRFIAAASDCREDEWAFARHADDPDSRTAYFDSWHRSYARLEGAFAPLLDDAPSKFDHRRLEEWQANIAAYRRQFLDFVGRVERGEIPDAAGAIAALDSTSEGSTRLIGEARQASEIAAGAGNAAMTRLKADILRGKVLVLIRGLLPLSILVLTGALFSRLVLRRLTVLAATLRAIAGGNLAARAPVDADDELGEVARHLNEMAQTIQETQTRLRAAHAAALFASDSKSRFLANMSHEIRTPMTAILGFADELTRNVARPEDVELAGTISRNGQHLLHVINDILDLSRIEAGKLTIQIEPVDLRDLLDEVRRLMRLRIEHRDLTLTFESPTVLPQTIAIDATRLRQILINLIGNAIKFTERGSIRVISSIDDPEGPEPRLRIEVVDTGPGIAPAELSRLFQPYSQIDSHSGRHGCGTGLGLEICKRLAEALSGSISISSRLGEGSTFTVVVPIGPLGSVPWVSADRSSSTEIAIVDSAGDRLQGRRILVVEDGPDNLRLIVRILERSGAKPSSATNGAEALAVVAQAEQAGQPFDLILMDMQMPVLDGFQATARLRESGYQRPIVALTAKAMQHDRERCLEAGCDDYLSKPISRADLVQLVGKLAASSASPRTDSLTAT